MCFISQRIASDFEAALRDQKTNQLLRIQKQQSTTLSNLLNKSPEFKASHNNVKIMKERISRTLENIYSKLRIINEEMNASIFTSG